MVPAEALVVGLEDVVAAVVSLAADVVLSEGTGEKSSSSSSEPRISDSSKSVTSRQRH